MGVKRLSPNRWSHKHLCQEMDLKVLLYKDSMFLQFGRFDSRVEIE